MNTVHYIGWYISEKDMNDYTGNIPGMLKMRYVTRKIVEAGFPPRVFSLANKKKGLIYKSQKAIENGIPILYSGGIHVSGRITRFINNLVKEFLFSWYFLFKVNKHDTVILYHSVDYSSLITWLNKFIHKNIILEVEEIYGYSAVGDDEKSLKSEFKSIRNNQKFILINTYLARKFSLLENSYVPCYGVADGIKRNVPRIEDGRIHVVYAGTIEGRKQGAYAAAEAAEYLPDNYILHILGFGKEENINILKQKIEDVNSRRSVPIVEYLGYKSGKDLDDFLYGCHIGVSTYVMKEDFANCSLPSKVFTYMCHDLAVVRGYASAYDGEEIAQNWSFYYKDTPQDIARAIVDAKIPEIGFNESMLKRCDAAVVQFLKNNC